MEKFLTQVSDDLALDTAAIVAEIMPMGHILLCYLGKDKLLADKCVKGISGFEYKITPIEYPDGVELDNDSIEDVIDCPDDVRLVLGVGGREIATILSKACSRRALPYALITDTPFLYGVGYALSGALPIKLLIDKDGKEGFDDYAKCVGAILAHRVALWEKKYVHHMLGVQDYAKLKQEEELLDAIIGDGVMSDTQRLFSGMLGYAKLYDATFTPSVELLAGLIEGVNLTSDRGESMLLSAIALTKYFKAIMSIEEYDLITPADISRRCRALAKIVGSDVSSIIKLVKDRKYQSKWLYIHGEYREDMLNEITQLDSKLVKIVKSAKRFMPDVGYHLGDDYDCNSIIQLIYNLSPIVHECSPISLAEALFGSNEG